MARKTVFAMNCIGAAPFAPALRTAVGVACAPEVTRTKLDVGVRSGDSPWLADGAEGVGVLAFPEAESATEALTTEPIPHAMFAPSGWVSWDGATRLLGESMIAKRPVQVLFEVDGEENW